MAAGSYEIVYILDSAPYWQAWADFLDSRPMIREADRMVQGMALDLFRAGWIARDEAARRAVKP